MNTIMKQILTVITGIALGLLFTACTPKTILSVGTQTLTFDNQGGSQTVSITANKVWSVTPDKSWCKVSPSSGDGSSNSNVSLSVTCEPNGTYDARTCTITVICEELTATISVTQAETTGLIVSQKDFSLNNEAQTVSFEVRTNVDFMVTVDGDATSWIKVQSTKGLSSNNVVLAISENKDYLSRTGKVTIKDVAGSLSETVTIVQSETYGIFIDKPEYNLSNDSHTLTVEVKANVDFNVSSGADWIKYVETKALKTSQIVLQIARNKSYDAREGVVTLSQKGGTLSGTITIRQDEAFGLIVSKTSYALSHEEQTIDVEVQHNVDLDVVIPEDCQEWILPVGTKGLTTTDFTFQIKANEGESSRTGSITFKQKDGALSGTVIIVQDAGAYIKVDPQTVEVSGASQEVQVLVETNVPYKVDLSAQDWILLGDIDGKKGITLRISENMGATREGKVVLYATEVSQTITVKQQGGVVNFKDDNVAAICIKRWDTDGDGYLSYGEAEAVTDLGDAFTGNLAILSFKELQYFTGLTQIGDKAFQKCVSLISIALPESVTSIGNSAFDQCAFGSITLPDNLKTIGKNAFQGCDRLQSIKIPEGVTSIGEDAFYLCTGLKSATLPSTLTKIARATFKGCNGLTYIRINEGVESIGDEAFFGCSGMAAVALPSTVTTIGKQAFHGCRSMTAIVIPDSVTSIGTEAFKKCSGLTSIAVPKAITAIPDELFYECVSLGSVLLPDGLTSIGNSAFAYCTRLNGVTLPSRLATIGQSAFLNCKGLTAISIPTTLETISDRAFSNCDQLSKVVMTKGLKTIGKYAFYTCPALKTVVIPETVSAIGEYAFHLCTAMESIQVLNTTPPTGGKGMFGKTNDCPIYVPAASVSKYKAADLWSVYASRIQAKP